LGDKHGRYKLVSIVIRLRTGLRGLGVLEGEDFSFLRSMETGSGAQSIDTVGPYIGVETAGGLIVAPYLHLTSRVRNTETKIILPFCAVMEWRDSSTFLAFARRREVNSNCILNKYVKTLA
jgi:hypothetical protein